MIINISGKETSIGNLEKVKFDTVTKKYMIGKYNCCGGDLYIQAKSNREVKDIIASLKLQGFVCVDEL